MKKFLSLYIIISGLCTAISAQTFPMGIKYQAVARNKAGDILGNQKISLKISLASMQSEKTMVHYSEVHDATTNELGLFTLVIGEGKVEAGEFSKVPWATEDIWMEIAIKESEKTGFVTISSSRLLAVPYAFHALTASSLVGYQNAVVNTQNTVDAGSMLHSTSTNNNYTGNTLQSGTNGVSSNVWSLQGNSTVNPETDKLGATNLADLVIKQSTKA